MSNKQEILEKLNLDDKDMANIEDDKPSDKGNIDKNAYLINHIKDNHEHGVHEDVREEMYDTLLNMTSLKLLESSNLFTYMICDEIREDSKKLMDSVLAMHGIITSLLCKFGNEIAEYLSPQERGMINVLFFGRTTEKLPSKSEILDIMREFSDTSDSEKHKTDLANALFPALVKGMLGKVEDVMEQASSTGIYATSKDDKILRTAISEKLLRRLFLPLKNGHGVYAVRLCDNNSESKAKKDIMELIDKASGMSEDEVRKMVKDMIENNKEKEKN